MSECGPDCKCGANDVPAPIAQREKRTTGKCGREVMYKTDGNGDQIIAICDRKVGHRGTHRGRIDFGKFGEKVFWRTQDEVATSSRA